MRQLSGNALTEIAKKLGTEPISILAVSWSHKDAPVYYSDKDLAGIEARILELGSIDSVLAQQSNSTAEISVTLDDSDSVIKAIFDTNDVHKRKCTLYQYFGDLSLVDKFTVFEGQLSTPFIWDEGARTVTFSILTEIENKEVGFSPEEGQFDFVSEDAVGKPWPLCFGNVIHVPAAKIRQATTGTLQQEVCESDILADNKLERLKQAYQAEDMIRQYFASVVASTEEIAPPVREILEDYVDVIKLEDRLMVLLTLALKAIDAIKKKFDLMPAGAERDILKIIDIPRLQRDVIILSGTLNTMRLLKDKLEYNTQLAEVEAKLKHEAFDKEIEAFNNMKAIEAAYQKLLTEQCNAVECQRSSVMVANGSKFPQNQAMDVLIKGVRYRVKFVGDLMTILGGPLAKYSDIDVVGAASDTCGDSTVALNNFTIADATKDLNNCYCLIETRTGEKHVIKITSQVDDRLTFQLVQWATSNQGDMAGGSGGMIHHDGGNDFPVFNTPFGPVAVDLLASGLRPQDAYNMCNAITPEVLNLLGPVSVALLDSEEFRTITKLQCLLDDDELSNDLVFLPDNVQERAKQTFTVVADDILKIVEASEIPLKYWFDQNTIVAEEVPQSITWRAEVGSAVVEYGERNCEIYVANILPSTIKAVAAYRTVKDQRFLATVPTSYYTKNESESMGPLSVTSIRIHTPLKNLNGGWEDELYVTLESSVGPNVVEILQWLIEEYTDRTVDSTSFNATKAKFRNGSNEELYPANFALLDRKNVFEELNNIAWQARCALIESNGVFYIKYLSEEPTPSITIAEEDIEYNSFKINLTETEDLVTRLDAKWKPNYLPLENGKQQNSIILRHNVKKYGLQKKEFDFYIYNIQELVIKSATFWLIRYANTWKRIEFNTFLHKMQLETLDDFNLSLSTALLADTDVTCLIEKATYDSNAKSISISAWTPVRAGEKTPYVFAWPANVDASKEFPTVLEIELGFAGGDGVGSTISATIEGC